MDEVRPVQEAHILDTLELEATEKARGAEFAIGKAKAALEQASSARRDMIAQIIAMAEKEAIAEAYVKSEAEYGQQRKRKKMLQGWTLLDMSCPHCAMQLRPLIHH